MELLAGEAERIKGLKWPTSDPLSQTPQMFRHAGKVYLPHEADGACVFLNRETGLCRIHAAFGMDAKPLGCQLYPFRIVPTFNGESSVGLRYDCPTVRNNQGATLAESLKDVRPLAQRMVLPPNFDAHATAPFSREQVEAICEFIATMINGFDRNDQKTLFILAMADWLQQIEPEQLDRIALAGNFVELKKRIVSASEIHVKGPGLLHRLAFRTLLGIYLRRDEDILNGHASRIARLLSMISVVLDFGNFAGLGIRHPTGNLRRAGLFKSQPAPASSDAAALHWRMIRAKLETFQFLGSANPNHSFIQALRSLALLWPLVLAAAKYRAGNRQATAVDESDIDYGVAAIEHSYGRGAMLRLPFARSLENFLLDPSGIGNLVKAV